MDCDRLREVLIDHVDGLLGREEAESARTHLAACGECRRLQEEVRRNFSALDAWEDEDLPAGSFERLVKRLPRGPVPRVVTVPASAPAGSRRWLRLAVPYAAGLATAAAAVAIFVVPAGGARPAEPGVAVPALPAAEPVAIAAPVPVPAAGPAAAVLRHGERALVFDDSAQGLKRTIYYPAGVDPANLQLVTDEIRLVGPSGGVR